MEKLINLREAGISLAWLGNILAALMSSGAGTWGKTFFDELLGKNAPLPNLTEWVLSAAHVFWLVPVCIGLLLIAARKRKSIQDAVVLVTWSLSILWLVCIIAAFLLPMMGLDWRLGTL